MAINPYTQPTGNIRPGADARVGQGAQNLGFGGGYAQWGTTSGAPANMPPPASNVPGMSNPYLGAQASAITQQANQNLQYNLLPSVNSGAIAAGGYGGSRQGIAQGLAMGQTQQGITNSLANLYGDAYKNDQNLSNQWGIAQMGNDTSRQNALTAADASKYGSDASRQASMYGSDKSSAASMYGADKSAAASMYGADKSSAASMYGADRSSAASMYGADKSADASRYASDNNLAANRYSSDNNLMGNMYSSNLGLAGSMYNADTSRANALTSADTQRYGYDTNLAGSIYGANASMYNNNNNNATNRYTADQNFYTSQRGQDLTQMQLGSNMLNSGVTGAANMGQGVYNVGQTTLNAPAGMMTNYNNIMQPVLNTTGTGTTTVQGSQLAGGLGGAIAGSQLGSQFANNLGFGSSGYNMYANPQNSQLMSMYGNGVY